MSHYSIGEGGFGSQAIYVADQMGPGVTMGTWGDHGSSAHIVGQMGPGAQAVYFEYPPLNSPHELVMRMQRDSQRAYLLNTAIADGPILATGDSVSAALLLLS